jgi:hypothetical protein
MTLISATGFSGLFALLLVLARPLTMPFMMRGMHGHGGIADRAEQATDERRQAVSP